MNPANRDAAQTARERKTSLLAPGTKAPDFTLHSTPDQTITLSELVGQPIILAFYPADWSPVCGDELVLFNELLPEFQRYDATLLGISVDGSWCHLAFAKDRRLRYPLLSDFEPKGEVSKEYGAYISHEGVSARAIILIDRNGVIHWSYRAPEGLNPGANGLLEALDSLQPHEKEQAA
ncbi:MAG: redoxin domain-containing protein [Chloroflexi bacterium]|nr:redoxin domain-containing protein [Chloroflexota bacterium]